MNKIFSTILIIFILSLTVSAQKVLQFDNNLNQHVNFEHFYRTYTPEKPHYLPDSFTFDIWLRQMSLQPTDLYPNGGYFVSVSETGWHPLLAGLFKDQFGKYAVQGNFDTLPSGVECNASASKEALNNRQIPSRLLTKSELAPQKLGGSQIEQQNFQSPAVFEENVWTLISIELYQNTVTIYKNGVPISKNSVSGRRIAGDCTVSSPSTGVMYGGSDHINSSVKIGQTRHFEGRALYKGRGFIPEVSFKDSFAVGQNFEKSNLLADFTGNPRSIIADLSNGYEGLRHNGHLKSAKFGVGHSTASKTAFPLPTWVIDNEYPVWGGIPVSSVPTADTAPQNALIFDGATRIDTTNFDGNHDLGQTEVGNETWDVSLTDGFAIVNGTFISIKPNFFVSALVEAVSNGEVSLDRVGNADIGIRYRSVDKDNGGVAFVNGGRLFVGSVTAGQFTWNHVAITGNWNQLKVVMNGANIVGTLSNNGSVVTTVAFTDNTYQSATKAGLYAYAPSFWNGDRFTVK